MSISFLSVFSNVSMCSAHLIVSFHPSSDLLPTTTSRYRLFSPLVANQTVVHLRRRSILCNFPPIYFIRSRLGYVFFALHYKIYCKSRFETNVNVQIV